MQQPSETWDKMTDEERIAFLAMEVMGWEKRKNQNSFWFTKDIENDIDAMQLASWDEEKQPHLFWNPLTSWDDFRQVEEKVMEDLNLWLEFMHVLFEELSPEPPEAVVDCDQTHAIASCMLADLPTRAKSLYLAHQSLQ